MAHKSTFSPRWHHEEEGSDTASIAAAVTASIEAAAAAAIASIKSARSTADVGAPQLLVEDTIDHVINSAEATKVEFSVNRLDAGASGTVTFTDAANHQVTAAIAANGTYSADLSSLTDGVVTSSITSTDSTGHTNSLSGNSVSLDTEKDLHPVLSVNAADPAHVTFSIAGFEGDEKGSITFTDVSGHTAVVNVGSNGNYSADLSSLTPGKVTYLLTETDPAGNTISIDPPIILGGDGSAGAPGGTPQLPHLLDSYATRPSWQVAGVDYAVGVNPGTTLKIPTAGNLPPGASLQHGAGWTAIYVDGNNVKLDGYDLTGLTVMINDDASGTVTISNCAATTGVNIRSTVGATANLVVQNCSLDGGGPAADPDFQLIKVWCPLTVEYSVIKDAPGGIYAGAPLTVLYNVMEGFGINGGHANAIYVVGGNDPTASTTIAYNTIYSEDARTASYNVTGLGAAIAFFGDGGNFYSSTVANNTLISALPSAASYLIGYYVGSGASATGGDVHDNYVASVNGFNNPSSGAFGTFYPGQGGVVQATYANNIDMSTGKIIDSSNVETASAGKPGTPSSAPAIASFSTDSGVVGDHITNDNTLTLAGTAVANSTVKVFDGTTQVGTATADSTGAWTLTTAKLADGSHTFTATDTVSGTISAASAALAVTIDTVAPNAPVETSASVVSGTTKVQLGGTAEANSTLQVFDGTTQVGTTTANSSGAWSLTTGNLATGGHSFNAKATDAAGNTSSASVALAITIPSVPSAPPTAPAAPTIVSFSTDSGVAGDHVTNDNAPTLIGTAVANSTVRVFDGTTQVGTATADSTGAWTVATTKLADGSHNLTATDTISGATSTASSPLIVTVDTVAPLAPILVSDAVVNTNHVLLSGTAEANSTIMVYDGIAVVGTATASPNGAWSVTTGALASGAQALTATAMDVAGNVSALSQPLDPVISSAPTPPAAPQITTFSTDSGIVGDHITNDNTPMLTGTAAANSTVNVFDGTTQVGTTTANSSGQWHLTSKALSDGHHNLTATDTDSSGHVSASSAAFSVTVDTHAPGAPTMAVYSLGGSTVGNTTALNDLVLKGTAEANSTIDIFDNGKQIGTTSTSASGAWSLDSGHLANGNHSFTATAIDVAGNISAASLAKAETVTAPATTTTPIEFTNVAYSLSNHTATIKGTADAYSQVKLYDGTLLLGTVTASGNGTWSLTNSHLSDTLHTIKAQEFDSTGHAVETSSGAVILAASNTSTLKGTGGDDFLFSSSSNMNDTFVFAPNFGHSTIEGFTVTGAGQDTVQFSKSVFDSFASVLAHATQVGQDVVISADASDSVTIKNTKLSALNSHDFHFA